ncbi:inter-alpha-trypsin inhibitor heavy chain H6-like isoform X2 [Engraulis encrasicolus]|uniref:inter-alpha-trypsin inhibitor heavy chain H6-like isoform X2 n=1 Tax=Engraulis encrasicolus TaxID=184585 RepID=UPI002FD5E84F
MEHLWEIPLAFLICASLTCVNFVEAHRSGAKKETFQLEVTEFHVKSVVVSRYARSTVLSTIFNPQATAQEAAFEVDLPSTAFISNFTITSNGKEYVSQVKGKQVAKKIYEAAKEKGQTAGLVETRHSYAEKFAIAISVPPGEHLSFKLSFEQLLVRRLGSYDLVLDLRPSQPVQNLSVEVTIAERTGISWVRVLPLQTKQRQHIPNTLAAGEKEVALGTLWRSDTQARVFYSPSMEEQTSSSQYGLNADFVLKYDIVYTDLIGDVQVYDGYFVHYFAPQELPIVPKEVVFVIDLSGSMSGTKLLQTKEAMDTILTDLRGHDYFNIITFATDVYTWKPNGTIPATAANIKAAKAFVKKMKVIDSTNINSALVEAGHLLRDSSASREARHRVPMVIFLTDGQANSGVTDPGKMRKNARNALGSAALFGLAFGQGADYDLVRQLSLDNRGVARRVYTDSAVVLQLKGFYDEVASPLLSEVQLSYNDDQAFEVTRSLFPNYFQGSELVVAGRVHPGARNLDVTLNAIDAKQHLTAEKRNLIPDPQPVEKPSESEGHDGTLDQEDISGFVQRLWAYMTIKELLLTAENTTDATVVAELKQNASNLSVKYNFVTPVTSMVVVKPDTQLSEGESTPDREDSTGDSRKQGNAKTPSRTRTHSGHSQSFSSSGDGDPHYVVYLSKGEIDLCFTIDGHANDVIRLVEDAQNGITVDGRLMWAPPEVGHEDVERTYYDQIVVSRNGPQPVIVTLTLGTVTVSEQGGVNRTLRTDVMGSVRGPHFRVRIDDRLRCWVDLDQGISFMVLLHHYKHPDYTQLNHLGFYLARAEGLSVGTQGLLGQFQHADIHVEEEAADPEALFEAQAMDSSVVAFGTLRRGLARVPVTLRRRMLKDTVRKPHTGHCWEVQKTDVEKILAEPYQAYVQASDRWSPKFRH